MNHIPPYLNADLSKYLPSGRVLSMDILRGLAIILMTVYHQGLVFALDARANTISHFMGYLAAPFFLAVSGGSLWHHENRHRRPLKMVAHGMILFLFAWTVDVMAHQSLKIDWDIFQLIGTGYATFGLFNILGSDTRKYVALTFLIGLWLFFPDLRPDKGVFALWPYGSFFLAGYFFNSYLKSTKNNTFFAGLFITAMLGYIVYWIHAGLLPQVNHLEGILFAISLCLLLWSTGLIFEYKKMLKSLFFRVLLRYGAYPLTLYYCQQITARFCMKYQIYLNFFSSKTLSWIFQASLLLVAMLLATFLFDRFKFLSIEWWLRKAEALLLKRLPDNKHSRVRDTTVQG